MGTAHDTDADYNLCHVKIGLVLAIASTLGARSDQVQAVARLAADREHVVAHTHDPTANHPERDR